MKHRISLKRTAALLLAFVLTGSLAFAASMDIDGVAAVAESTSPDTTDERMARVTTLVKEKLDLDTEAYTDFSGGVSEQELGVVWDLYWGGDGMSLSVEALEDGTVISYYYNDNQDYYTYSSNLSTFPKTDVEKAKAAAQTFLTKVLNAGTESVELEEPAGRNTLGRSITTFNGKIRINGLDSPLSYYISVRGSDNLVTSFHRDAPSITFSGNIPSPVPTVQQSTAAATLRGTLKLELVYVTSEDDSTRAVLRYVPKDQETLYVDAQTGALVKPGDRTYLTNASAAMEEAMDPDAGGSARSLTQAELTGIDKMSGVLDKDALDRMIRAESAYQLDGFTLSTARYRLVKDENDVESVQCSIRYTVPDADTDMDINTPRTRDTRFYNRNFTVNARTGEVLSLYSYGGNWNDERVPDVNVDQAREIAQSFLNRFTTHAAAMPLNDTSDETANGAPSYDFTFTRQANGYFYPENAANITIDCMSGAVIGVSYRYDDAVTFDSAQNLISMDRAIDAWLGTYDVTLAYRLVGKELDAASGALEARLIDIGITQFYELFLSYGLERETYCPGIDAKSGTAVETVVEDGTITYTDVSGHAAESDIRLLASYNIGYTGGTFQPDKSLTQWDVVCLLVSTQGYRVNPDDADQDVRNNWYAAAYHMGALTKEERQDDAAVTRGQLVRLLINSAGYGAIARLDGIFTCQYLDRASIPVSDMGYAALAQGFGLVQNVYGANHSATRADAAVMLCRLMERAA